MRVADSRTRERETATWRADLVFVESHLDGVALEVASGCVTTMAGCARTPTRGPIAETGAQPVVECDLDRSPTGPATAEGVAAAARQLLPADRLADDCTLLPGYS